MAVTEQDSKRFHINRDTGRVAECRARKRACPFGSLEEHFPTREAAVTAAEDILSKEYGHQRQAQLKEMDADALANNFLDRCGELGMDTKTLADTVEFASLLHAGQTRGVRGKRKSTPYIEHPLRAAYRLVRMGVRDQEVITAALLHDTVEDCSTIFVERVLGEESQGEVKDRERLLEYISHRYSPGTAKIVKSVTNDYQDKEEARLLLLAEKRRIYKDHLEREVTDSPKALLVKLADFIDNAGSLYHQDLPGNEKRVTRMARKYRPCAGIFIRELEKRQTELSKEEVQFALQQVRKISERLDSIIAKYPDN